METGTAERLVSASMLQWKRVARKLRFDSITVRVDEADGGARTGFVTYLGDLDGRRIKIMFEWREALPLIVALSNPLYIECNVLLIDEKGERLSRDKHVCHFTAAISKLPWQSLCLRELESRACKAA